MWQMTEQWAVADYAGEYLRQILTGEPASPEPAFLAKSADTGLFVRLFEQGIPRHCFGETVPAGKISWGDLLRRHIANVAQSDWNFAPPNGADLPLLHLEITQLGGLVPYTDGKRTENEGISTFYHERYCTLLPQIIRENRWDEADIEQFFADKGIRAQYKFPATVIS